jgi:three-Cys-motif partner protein
MENDGLAMRESGEWVKRKDHYLRRYCEMFTVAMKGKWKQLTYLDLLAGPGRCVVKNTGEILPGSPLIALEYDFDWYEFYDSEAAFADALKIRVADHEKASQCRVCNVRWEDAVLSPSFHLPDGLILAFVDPTGISQVPWKAMQRLTTASQRIDILMTIQHGMGIKLNKPQYLAKKDQTAVDAFLGSNRWRSKLAISVDFCEAVLSEFTDNMRALGFQTRKWMPVKNESGQSLYYLCLFSRHRLALQFWDQVVLKDEAGQRAMDL